MSKGGRPSDYSQAKADAICERLARGESLRTVCVDPTMPAVSTVLRWIGQRTEFRDQYARAREAQADAIFDEMIDIADDGTNDWMEREGRNGIETVVNTENIQRSRLRVDARKWILGKLNPKKYGERQTVEHEFHSMSDAELIARASGSALVVPAVPVLPEPDND